MVPTSKCGGTRLFYEALLHPVSIFEYLTTVVAPLVSTRLVDAITMVVSMGDMVMNADVRKDMVSLEPMVLLSFDFCVPAWGERVVNEVLDKYSPMLEGLFKRLYSDLAYRLIKAEYTLVDSTASPEDKDRAKELLREHLGEPLFSNAMWFVKNIEVLRKEQVMEMARKIAITIFQRVGGEVTHLLGEKGVVIRDPSAPLDTYRILWILQRDNTASTGVYDLPESKVQALSLLRSILPGLIDYNTDESEFTRIAKLAQRLNDEEDINTLIGLINKAYLHNIDITDLTEAVGKLTSQRKSIVYALLSFILAKRNGYLTYIDIEGKTPIVITYPKTPYIE
jgi:hypothetical protein